MPRPPAAALIGDAPDYLEGLLEGFVAYDAAWRLIYVNAAGERILGRARDELLGKTWHEAFPHAIGNVLDRMYQRVMSTRAAERVELFYEHYGRWMEISASPARSGGIGVYFRDATERNAAEAALRDSEQKLRFVTDHVPVLIVHCDAEGRYRFVNEPYASRFGLRREDVVGRTIAEVLGAAAYERLRPHVEGVLRGERVEFEEALPYDRLGTQWMRCVYVPQRGSDGRVDGFVAVIEDVTERRAAVAALGESEQRLRAIVESTPECVKTVAADGTLLQMNRAGLAMVGARDGARVIGRPVYDLVAPEDRSRFRAFHEAVCRGDGGTLEFDVVALDGGRRHMETHAVPLRQPDGSLAQLALARDVTERKRAERELRENEERLRLAFEAGRMGSWEWHMGENRVVWSPALEALHGLEPGSFPGSFEAYQRDIHPDDREHVQRAIAESLSGDGTHQLEYRIVRPDGAVRWVEGRGRVFRDGEGRVTRLMGVCVDVTERKRAEQALRDADRRKDEFLATLSHELRNPLAPLKNALQVLELSGGDARVAPLREMMERQVNHLVRLVDDLLEMSRISRGALELRRERVALSAVVRSALETSQPLIRAAGHQLSLELPGEPLWLDGDPVRLAQIVANLLNNAAKYTEPGGRISVAARRRGAQLELTVRDNGIGIPADVLPRLFEMFSRGGGADRSGQGGLGIGLALARRLAEMHGGTLVAASEGPGRGAEFTLALPLAARPEQAAPQGARELRGALHARRILIVDDNHDAAHSLGMVLKYLGADVQVAHDGAQALETLRAYEPGVVFLDIGMPGMDGYEVARRIRAQRLARPPAIVALTGWGQEQDRRRAREAGFDHHLVKPADLGQLQALLASLDEAPQLH